MRPALGITGDTGVSFPPDESSRDDHVYAIDSAVLLNHLEDDLNRRFLNLMSFDWRTAQELTTICETPLSTTYRKLNALEEAGFLERRIRVNSSGKHPEEYRAKPMVLTFRIGDSTGLEVNVNTIKTSD